MTTQLLSQKVAKVREYRAKYGGKWMAPCFGKEKTKEFAREFGIRTPATLARFNSILDLPPLDKLPTRCVIKPVKGNGNRGVFCIVDGVELMDNQTVTRESILAHYAKLGHIARQAVLIEEFIEDWNDSRILPRDYKFYNFGNRTAFIHVIERRSRKVATENKHWFISSDCKPFPYRFVSTQRHSEDPLSLPPFFDEMLSLSQQMARKLNSFMRVDLYADKDGPLLGELTPFPHGGKSYMKDADEYLGSMWRGYYGASRMDFIKHLRVKYLGH